MRTRDIDRLSRALDRAQARKKADAENPLRDSPAVRAQKLRALTLGYLADFSTKDFDAFMIELTEARISNPWRIQADANDDKTRIMM